MSRTRNAETGAQRPNCRQVAGRGGVNCLPVGHRDRRGRRTELRCRYLQHHHLSERPHRARNRVPHIGTEPSGARFTLQCEWQGGTNIGGNSTWDYVTFANGLTGAITDYDITTPSWNSYAPGTGACGSAQAVAHGGRRPRWCRCRRMPELSVLCATHRLLAGPLLKQSRRVPCHDWGRDQHLRRRWLYTGLCNSIHSRYVLNSA
jgi:hypothetical protein